MTRERALELARELHRCSSQCMIPGNDPCARFEDIADAILAAVAEEREACAKIADSPVWTTEESVCATIAAQIRARGERKAGA